MRIAYLTASSRIGGSEVVLLNLWRELARLRAEWDLHLVAPTTGPLVDRASALGVQVTVLPMPPSLLRLGETGAGRLPARLLSAAVDLREYERRLAEALHAIRPDVVHSNGIKTHVTSARARGGSRPLLWHMHDYVARRRISRMLLRRYAARPSAIVANSRSVAQDVASAVQPPVPVRTIYNGIDVDRFSPAGATCSLDAAASMPPPPPDTVRVGLVATFARWKGHETFLRAVAALAAVVPVRGYVVGGPIYDTEGSQHAERDLRALALELGIAPRIGFTGFLPAIDDVMRALDVVVHASAEPEPFGLVVAEAMACGRPVVTSATGGAAELVRDGVDALTFPPGDHAALGERIARLAGDRALRARLGASARETARARFDARRCAEEFIAAYEGMAGRSRGAA